MPDQTAATLVWSLDKNDGSKSILHMVLFIPWCLSNVTFEKFKVKSEKPHRGNIFHVQVGAPGETECSGGVVDMVRERWQRRAGDQGRRCEEGDLRNTGGGERDARRGGEGEPGRGSGDTAEQREEGHTGVCQLLSLLGINTSCADLAPEQGSIEPCSSNPRD